MWAVRPIQLSIFLEEKEKVKNNLNQHLLVFDVEVDV